MNQRPSPGSIAAALDHLKAELRKLWAVIVGAFRRG